MLSVQPSPNPSEQNCLAGGQARAGRERHSSSGTRQEVPLFEAPVSAVRLAEPDCGARGTKGLGMMVSGKVHTNEM